MIIIIIILIMIIIKIIIILIIIITIIIIIIIIIEALCIPYFSKMLYIAPPGVQNARFQGIHSASN